MKYLDGIITGMRSGGNANPCVEQKQLQDNLPGIPIRSYIIPNPMNGHGTVPINLMKRISSKQNSERIRTGDYSGMLILVIILKNRSGNLKSREKYTSLPMATRD